MPVYTDEQIRKAFAHPVWDGPDRHWVDQVRDIVMAQLLEDSE